MDVATCYARTRAELLALAARLSAEDAMTPVPALPGWSVRDAYAHLAGVCADLVDGNLDGLATPPWTARQLAERTGRALPEIAEEWGRRGPEAEAWAGRVGDRVAIPLAVDCWQHQQDVLGALGRRGEREDERVTYLAGRTVRALERRFAEHDTPELRLVCAGNESVLGSGLPSATLRIEGYELLRVFGGRRSPAQIAAADWEGDPAPYLDQLHLFDLPLVDLVD